MIINEQILGITHIISRYLNNQEKIHHLRWCDPCGYKNTKTHNKVKHFPRMLRLDLELSLKER
jgi:hypothetical protein